MCEEFFEEPLPELTPWSREALDHLSADLHRSKSEMGSLMAEEADHPAFDPLKVRDMIRECTRQGHEPTALVLGQIEAASFYHFIILSVAVSVKNQGAISKISSSWASSFMRILARSDSS